MTENRPITGNRRGPGRPFQPGESGNPGGRPKGLVALVREQTQDGNELIEFMLNVMRNTSESTPNRIRAGEWLADRGFGKAYYLNDLQDFPEKQKSIIELVRESLQEEEIKSKSTSSEYPDIRTNQK